MPSITRDGYSLWYRWSGIEGKPVLVLSHSLGSDHTLWEPQLDRLSKAFRLVLYDHPGHGSSGLRPTIGTIDDYGRDVIALMDFLNIRTACFCGLSLGGMVGMWLGTHHGHRFEKLVLANTTARIENAALLKGRIDTIRRWGLEGITESVVEKWLTSDFRKANPETTGRIKAMFLRTQAHGYADTAQVVCDLDLRKGL
jgi:3-oxoadipate enol-lactonase